MPKKKPRPKYVNPAKNRGSYGDLIKSARPSNLADPRQFSSAGMSGPGGPHDRDGVVVDVQNAILQEGLDVCVMEIGRQGAFDEQAAYLQMHGRINKSPDRVNIGFLLNTDGVAALITELLALSWRDSVEMLDDVTRRLTALHRGQNVDLFWLKAAIENAIEAQAEDQP